MVPEEMIPGLISFQCSWFIISAMKMILVVYSKMKLDSGHMFGNFATSWLEIFNKIFLNMLPKCAPGGGNDDGGGGKLFDAKGKVRRLKFAFY